MSSERKVDAIIVVTLSRWDQDFSSASISLAKELSKTTPVFFIDNPFTIKDVLTGWRTPHVRRRIFSLLFGINRYKQIVPENKNWIAVTPYMVVPINWLPPGWLYNVLSGLNNWLFMRSVRAVIHDFQLKRFIFFNSFNPFFGYKLPQEIKPLLYVYQSRDNIKESAYINKHGPRLERIVSRQADLRLATSTDLVQQLSTDNHPFVFFPNAADFTLFEKATKSIAVPDDVKGIRKPVIGYIGNICLRIDYILLKKLAESFDDCTILMVGPRNDENHHNFDFSKYTNMVFVGSKRLNQLPEYLSIMNCTILPFKKNALTRSIYPLKINEYLAAGKPVVSTSFSPDIEGFRDNIYIASSTEEFIANVRHVLTLNEPDSLIQSRMNVAKTNSWPVRVHQFWGLVNKFL